MVKKLQMNRFPIPPIHKFLQCGGGSGQKKPLIPDLLFFFLFLSRVSEPGFIPIGYSFLQPSPLSLRSAQSPRRKAARDARTLPGLGKKGGKKIKDHPLGEGGGGGSFRNLASFGVEAGRGILSSYIQEGPRAPSCVNGGGGAECPPPSIPAAGAPRHRSGSAGTRCRRNKKRFSFLSILLGFVFFFEVPETKLAIYFVSADRFKETVKSALLFWGSFRFVVFLTGFLRSTVSGAGSPCRFPTPYRNPAGLRRL